MVQERDDIVGLDAGILMHPQVWVTSGHVGSFSDPLVECQTDHRRFRLDELPGAENLSATDLADPTIVERLGLRCPVDGGPLSAPRRFNLMFKTFMGPVEDETAVIYLRPETAQGSYVNFKNVQQSTRKKLPFGIAQIGKSFRNEISPGNFVFRMREFEQMEMQYFVRPDGAAAEAFEMWLPKRRAWYERYGVTPERLRLREHAPDELAHYAKKAVDVEYRFPFGWKELEGVHNRGDFDLSRHSEASGEKLEYFDQATNEHVIPWVVETAAGADRAAFTFLIDAYREEDVRGETRVSLALHPDLAPYKVAVLPLLKKRPEIVELCHRIKDDLKRHMMAVYDDTAAIGKLYRRQDEIGTPWCITVDVESLEDGAVTVRDRDTMAQERIPIEGVTRLIVDRLEAARAVRGLIRPRHARAPRPAGNLFAFRRDILPERDTTAAPSPEVDVDQRELVERAQRGDRDAFAALAALFVARLDAAARLILRDHELARDAVQEGFLGAWRNLPTLRDPDRFEAWLRRLVFRSCIDVLRRRGRRPIEVELLEIDGPPVADIASLIADRDLLELALRRLAPEQRAVIVLHYYLGMPLPDVAAALGIPIGTAKSRHHRSLALMRAAIDADPDAAVSPAAGGQYA